MSLYIASASARFNDDDDDIFWWATTQRKWKMKFSPLKIALALARKKTNQSKNNLSHFHFRRDWVLFSRSPSLGITSWQSIIELCKIKKTWNKSIFLRSVNKLNETRTFFIVVYESPKKREDNDLVRKFFQNTKYKFCCL